MDETTTVPTWGYKPDGSAEIFPLAPGESLPAGWHASPDCIADPALATAEALTARRDGRPSPAVLDILDEVADQPVAVLDADLTNALAEIARLSDIIATGSTQNERLVAEIEGAEGELQAMATEIASLRELLTKAQEDGGFAMTERDAALAKLDAMQADLAKALADLEAATAPKPARAGK